MKENWVDFKAVKAAVSIDMVLKHYSIDWLKKSGDELRGRCPIHKGEGQSTFHANLTKNAFNCFSCKARGNVLDFVAAMERCSMRDAAIKLAEWFGVDQSQPTRPIKKQASADPPKGETEQPVNKPLGFALKGVDCTHQYLAERGITKETAEAFGVGLYSGRGSMNGRIVIPIHNETGELVAYAGRSIDGTEPRYKLPVGFHKSLCVYNLHRVEGNEVVVVEGFFDCMKLWQSGCRSVALMGCSLSEHQEELLVRRFKRVTLMLDGDSAGREAAEQIANRLMKKVFVRVIELADGMQPDQLDEEGMQQTLWL